MKKKICIITAALSMLLLLGIQAKRRAMSK